MVKGKELFKPVEAITTRGVIMLRILWLLYSLIDFFWRHKKAKEFEENPLTMTWIDSIYLGYKYYYRSPKPSEKSISFFKQYPFSNNKESDFDNTEGLSISLGGDLMPYANINVENCSEIWTEIGEEFFESDIVFANLETPIDLKQSPSLVPEIMLNHMEFNTTIPQFGIFNGLNQFKGFDILSLANNHSLDKGENGIRNTIQFLHQKKIKTIGVAFEPNSKQDLAIIEKGGIKTGWLAFTFCTNHFSVPEGKEYLVNTLSLNTSFFDCSFIQEKVKWLKENGADFIFASLHMGNAYQPLPNSLIIENFKKIAEETDIDYIIGTHPHNPQPFAEYKTRKGRKVIFAFSLGDFIADDIYIYGKIMWISKIKLGRNIHGKVEVLAKYNKLIEMKKENTKLKLKYFDENSINNKSKNSTKLNTFYLRYLHPYHQH
jgi:poly-gamma-glutamate synthesis protein (capsule biosynthesis protein)